MRCAILLLLITCAFSTVADEASDIAAARAVFEENIEAIRQRDRDRYLSLYLKSDRLVRTGPAGFATGYDSFAAGTGAAWPDTLEATDMRLTPIRPGIVYGTYRYRVRYGADEQSGISERLFVETPEGWKIALTGAIATPGIPPSPRAITGATLIDGRGGAPVKNANVVIRDGKIECAGVAEACEVPASIDVVDARGAWVTPGLVDSHVHFSQTGWADGRPDSLDLRTQFPYDRTIAWLKEHAPTFGRTYLCSGVTAVFDVAGYPWTLDLSDRADPSWPHVATAGPALATVEHWLNLPGEQQFVHVDSPKAAADAVSYLAARGADAIKVWYIQEDVEALAAAGEAAARLKIPLIVHATELESAKQAVRAGARLLVHSVWNERVDDELIALMKERGTMVTPTLTVLNGYLRMFDSILSRKAPVIDDPNGCVDAATRSKILSTASVDPSRVNAERHKARIARSSELDRMTLENFRRLVAAGIPIATGTDAGNPLTLHGPSIYAEMEAMQAAGMTPMQVLVSSTSIAARAAGLESVAGTIEPGKSADLLILDADPTVDIANFRRIRSVVRGGVVRGIEELSAMAKGE